jgi:ubiquinone/menaquinone biosynthesis C-methylase UbiE
MLSKSDRQEIMNLVSVIRMIINALVKPTQYVLIPEIPKGNVLDIGGGGEGVIAQAGETSVYPIDKLMSEILEARGKAPNAYWMVADGKELPLANECFDNATAFLSCMYMPENIESSVFRETRRVLKSGSEFWIWDVNISPKSKVFAIRLQVDIPGNRTIKTVYGVRSKAQSAGRICDLLQETGFEAEVITNSKHWFFIRALRL